MVRCMQSLYFIRISVAVTDFSPLTDMNRGSTAFKIEQYVSTLYFCS